MQRMIISLAAAALVAAAMPSSAKADCHGCGVGAGIAAGILGGAIVNSNPGYYGPQPGYVVYNGYGAPYPVACPGGYWARRPLRDGYGNVVGWSRPRFICP